MEERFKVISPCLNGYAYIHDLKTLSVLNTYDSCDLLNQQDKRIKELELQLKDSEKKYIKSYQEGLLQKQFDKDMEITELKQQLRDLPKQIVGEIKEQIMKDVDVTPNYYDDFDFRFSTRSDCIECLDTILKKYRGENE